MFENIIRNFNVKRIWFIIKKGLVFMILFGLIGAAVGWLFADSRKNNMYQAQVSFYVYSKSDYIYDTSINISSSEFSLARNLVNSYVMVMKSANVLNKVIATLGLDMDAKTLMTRISYQTVSSTAIFHIFVSDTDPYRAMMIANALADVAPEAIADIVKSGGISVLDYATLPTAASSSINVLKYVVFGGAGGFALVFALCMLFGLLDTRIMWKSELDSAFDIPTLGEIPYVSVGKKKNKDVRIIKEDSPFALKESYNSLCTNLLYTTNGETCPVYTITSAVQNEGKTLSSVNIAKTLALLGKKVILLDADLRNPSVAHTIGINDEDIGLSQYLAAIEKKINIIHQEDNFDVVVAGVQPPNPSQLLAGERVDALLDDLKKQYDFIIIDVPPVGVVSDALLLKERITGYLLVVRAETSKYTDELRIVEEFEKTSAPVAGFIFNAVDAKSTGYSGYNYEYGGYAKNAGKKKR